MWMWGELANRIGVTFQRVRKYGSGANRIAMGRLVRIGRVLGVGVTYLLGGSGRALPPRGTDPKEQARLADGLRMLGRVGPLRLLRAFAALLTKPPSLRVNIVEVVEKTAVARGKETVPQRKRRRRVR
jgi:transcriptional regulator with XRE-family HTH domain